MTERIVICAFSAWAVGLLTAGIVVFPGLRVLGDDPAVVAQGGGPVVYWLNTIPIGLFASFTAGVLLSLPFFAIGLGFGIVRARQVATRPGLHAVLAGLVTAGLFTAFAVIQRDNIWAQITPLPQKFVTLFFSSETALFALPVVAGALFFGLRLRRIIASEGGGPQV